MDINRSSTTTRQEGTVLRMEEMTERCTTATGSGRRRFCRWTNTRRGELVFQLVAARARSSKNAGDPVRAVDKADSISHTAEERARVEIPETGIKN